MLVLFATLAPPEPCRDWEIIQYCGLFVLESRGSCGFDTKPALSELDLHSCGNAETSLEFC